MADNTTAPEPTFREQVEAAESTPAAPEAPQETAPESQESAPEQPQEGATAEGEPQAPDTRQVPLGALHEERQKRKNAEAARAEDRRQMQILQNQQVEMMRYVQSLQQPQQQPIPSFDSDPMTNIGATVHQTASEVQQLRNALVQRDQAESKKQAMDQFVGTVTRAEQAFAQKAPDYFEAVTWARDRKAQEYVAIGLTEQDAWARVNNEAADLAYAALNRGESPAEVGYRLAKTIGYTPKPQANDAQQKLEMQRNGRAARTPSGGSGLGGGTLSLDALAKMSGSEFLKATSGDAWKKLMSGK